MEQLFNLPNRVKYTLAATGLGSLLATGLALGSGKWIFLIVLVIALAVLLGGYLLISAWRRKRQNARLGSELQQHTTASPRGISDPGQRARLDDLRKKFEQGVTEYRSRGKDLYKLPWYAIVGEPGSGKTEAVRHSNVGFPPGMQDEFQGVGGTINMNWWFTNHAVLLDTAGRLMFEEVKPGETSEWKEFLGLLKKNRVNCPINGLMLVIPSDTLIKDSADQIAAKAGTIARQLDTIQRILDVRFPVYVIVTKCDKINGFREFFDGLTDPQLQHQMIGWSNPDPLDSPFRPELVDQHLNHVVQRLRKRRLGLMRDPIASPDTSSGRRADEVDSLYALPHSLSLLSSRLRRYLETIFVASEWSAKPLFLRGIYFTSAMREGSALDQDLAEAMGLSVDALPEGKVWERDRAYFLRDLFLEKAFRERGLVTRASNTKRMLRNQQIALFTVGGLALALFIVMAWYGLSNFRSNVGQQSSFWHAASTAGWVNKTSRHSLIPIKDDGTYASYVTNTVVVDNKPYKFGEFQTRLKQLAETPLKKSWLLPGLADAYNKSSKRAQRIFFETSVVKPAMEAARKKMVGDESVDEKAMRFQPDALGAMIRVEGDIVSRLRGAPRDFDLETAHKFLAPLLSYVTGQEVSTLDTNLVSTMIWTYTANDQGRGTWPPVWLSGSTGVTNTLVGNSPIRNGLELFIRSATNSVQTQVVRWKSVDDLRQVLKKYDAAENRLLAAVRAVDEAAARAAQNELNQLKTAVDAQLRDTTNTSAELFKGTTSLSTALQTFRVSVSNNTAGVLDKVKAANERGFRDAKDHALYTDIRRRLEAAQGMLVSRVNAIFVEGDEEEMKRLDEAVLAGGAYSERWGLYSRSSQLWAEDRFQKEPLIGLRGEPLDRLFTEQFKPLREKVAGYAGQRKNEATMICEFYLKRAEDARREEFFRTYLQQAQKELGGKLGFPLLRDTTRSALTVDQLKDAGKSLGYFAEDLAAPSLKNVPAGEKNRWEAFAKKVASLDLVRKAVISPEGLPANCSVSLAGMGETLDPKDNWREDGYWRGIKLSYEGGNTRAELTNSREDLELAKLQVQQRFQLQLLRRIEEGVADTTYAAADWGVFELIHKFKGQPLQKGDLTTWIVQRPLDHEKYKTAVRLKLRFDRPLPEVENWPAE